MGTKRKLKIYLKFIQIQEIRLGEKEKAESLGNNFKSSSQARRFKFITIAGLATQF